MSRPKNRERVPAVYPKRRKVCPRCERDLPWTMFYPLKRHDDGVTVARVRSKCKVCEHELASDRWRSMSEEEKRAALDKKREWWHKARATDPEFVGECREYAAAQARHLYATNPEHREKVKRKASEANRRPDKRARANEARRKRAAEARAQRARESATKLPIGPFRDWIEQHARRLSMGELAALLGVTERRVWAWMNTERVIKLNTLDRALCRAGEPGALMDLYPDLYADDEECAA